jgi:hypothetical protein
VEAAAANIIDPLPSENELGLIAKRAMATMPNERFREAKEFQQSIRDCRTHAQSERLVNEADKLAASALLQQGYDEYSSALHAYEEALMLWNGNQRASTGQAKTRIVYAERALSVGDLDLAASLVKSDGPGFENLRTRIATSRTRRAAHASRQRHLMWVSGSLLILLVVALIGGIVVTESERRLVVNATHDRDHAEAQLAYRESQRQKEEHQRWQWEPVLYEDFEKGVLPTEISVLSGRWSVNHGQLLAGGEVRSELMTRSTRGDIRVRLDVVAYRPMQLYLALPSTAVNGPLADNDSISVAFDRQCHIYRGRHELAAHDMPEIVNGVSQRIAVQREGHLVRVQVNGQLLISADAGDIVAPTDAHLIISADPGTTLEDLRIERQRGQVL